MFGQKTVTLLGLGFGTSALLAQGPAQGLEPWDGTPDMGAPVHVRVNGSSNREILETGSSSFGSWERFDAEGEFTDPKGAVNQVDAFKFEDVTQQSFFEGRTTSGTQFEAEGHGPAGWVDFKGSGSFFENSHFRGEKKTQGAKGEDSRFSTLQPNGVFENRVRTSSGTSESTLVDQGGSQLDGSFDIFGENPGSQHPGVLPGNPTFSDFMKDW